MHPKKIIAGVSLAVVGIAAGAILTTSVNADDTTDTSPPWFRWLSEEQQAEVSTKLDAEQTLMESVEREVVKTDDGLQITISSDNAEAVEMLHDRYDENGGEFPGFGGMGEGRGGHGMRLHRVDDTTEESTETTAE